MAINYAKIFNRRATPQSQPIPGSSQVRNSGGGYSWQVDDWTRLDRFLIFGAKGGTYYITERDLVKQNHDAVFRWMLNGADSLGDAKAVVVGMTSNGFTIADPNDRGMLDVVGFDTTAPSVIADFVRS